MDDRLTLYGSFTSSSSYKPMLFLAPMRGVQVIEYRLLLGVSH